MTQPQTLTGQDIAEAQGAVRALLDSALQPTGYTDLDFVVLRVLSVRGPFTPPATLHDFLVGQRQLGLTASSVAALLARLEAAGLATGTSLDGPGPAQATPDGAATHVRLSQLVGPVTQRLYADFDPADLVTTRRVLMQVIERADEIRQSL